MNKILIFGMTENPGGVESFLMNYYRHLDKTKFQFDFLCNSYEKVAYEDEILELGGKTFHFPARSQNIMAYREKLEEFFKKRSSEYHAIWVNVCSLANIDYLKLAKKYGISKRIIHSHNSQNMDSKLRGILHLINKNVIGRYATHYWACSKEAADWFYNKELQKDVVIIHNAIDVERMAFDSMKRKKIRESLGWENKFVIGNIGRLHFQKNQMFILEIFYEVLKQLDSARLILVGQGEDEAELKKRVEELEIGKYVYFAGIQYDIAGRLSAFDLFLFPSKFEGLSIVALEAQANGLIVLASKGVIPEDVCINDNFEFYSLRKSAVEWASKIVQMKSNLERKKLEDIFINFIQKGYSIDTEIKKLEGLFGESDKCKNIK